MQFETPPRPTRPGFLRDTEQKTPPFQNVYSSPYQLRRRDDKELKRNILFTSLASDRTYRSVFTASLLSLLLHGYLSGPMLWRYGLQWLLGNASFSSLMPWYCVQSALLFTHVSAVFVLFAARTWYKRAIAPKKSSATAHMHFRKRVVHALQKGRLGPVLAYWRKASAKKHETVDTHHVTCRLYKTGADQCMVPKAVQKDVIKSAREMQKARHGACVRVAETSDSVESTLHSVWKQGRVKSNQFVCMPCPEDMIDQDRVHTALRRFFREISRDDVAFLLSKSRLVELTCDTLFSHQDATLGHVCMLLQGSMFAMRDGLCVTRLVPGDSLGVDLIYKTNGSCFSPQYTSGSFGAQMLVVPLADLQKFTDSRAGLFFSTWITPEFRAAWNLLQRSTKFPVAVDMERMSAWQCTVKAVDELVPESICGFSSAIYIVKEGVLVDTVTKEEYHPGDCMEIVNVCIGGYSRPYKVLGSGDGDDGAAVATLYKLSYDELINDNSLHHLLNVVCIEFSSLINYTTGLLGLKNVFLPYNSTVRSSLFLTHAVYIVSGCVTESRRSSDEGMQVGISVREGDEILATEDRTCTCGFDLEHQGVFFSTHSRAQSSSENERKYACDVVSGGSLSHPAVQTFLRTGDMSLVNSVMFRTAQESVHTENTVRVHVDRDAQAMTISQGAVILLHKHEHELYMRLLYRTITPGSNGAHGSVSERLVCVIDGADEDQRKVNREQQPTRIFAHTVQMHLTRTEVVLQSALRPQLQIDGEQDSICVRSALANILSLLTANQRVLLVVDGATDQTQALLARLADRTFLVQVADHFGVLAEQGKLPAMPAFTQDAYPFDLERFLPFSVQPATSETALWIDPPVFPYNRAMVNEVIEHADLALISCVGWLPGRAMGTATEPASRPAPLQVDLVLMHGAEVDTPLFSRAYTRRRRVRRLFHVSLGEHSACNVRYSPIHALPADYSLHYKRIAHSLSGASTGLALSGGGARGIAHVGVLQSLAENNVDVDMIVGASQGACVSVLHSMTSGWGMSSGALHAAVRGMGVSFGSIWGLQSDATIPMVSYFSGKSFNEGLIDVLSVTRTVIPHREAYQKQISLLLHQEDLWIPTITTVTNISRGSALYRREGWLFRNVRASMSILGFLPYCYGDNGDIWIDGGYSDNIGLYPLLQECAKIIASDVENKNESHQYHVEPWGMYISGIRYCMWRVLRAFVPSEGHKKWYLPSFTGLVDTLLFLAHNRNMTQVEKHIDLYLRPRVQEFKQLDYDKYERIIDAGYQRTDPLIKEYLERLAEQQ